MAELKNLVESVEKKISEMHENSKSNPLHSQSPLSRVKTIEEYLHTIQEISADVSMMETACEAEKVRIETKKTEEELLGLEKYLKRNLYFEQQKLERQGNPLMEQKTAPEIYASIEEKISSASMKLWYLLEKILVELKSRDARHSGTGTRNAFELLKAKEAEIEEYKKKYNSLLSQGLVARIAGETSADLEESIHVTSKNLEAGAMKLYESIAFERKSMEDSMRAQEEAWQRAKALEQLLQNYMSKNLELVTLLKKEKESALKNFTDMEHETAKLRTMYSKKILDLEEEKMEAKNSIGKELEEKISNMRNELKKKDEYLEHFKQLVEEKEAELRKLVEENERLRSTIRELKEKKAKHAGKKKK